MPQITVWSRPACVQCKAVQRWLDKEGLEYEAKELLEHPEKLDQLKGAGFMQAPVVESSVRETFSGFNPTALQEIKTLLEEQA